MSEPEPRPNPRPPGTIRVGSLAGADVLVSTTWFLIAGMIAVLLAPHVERVEPGLGAGKYLAGVAFAVIFYGSILLHEGSHAVVAKHYGYPVTSITLHFLGGFTEIEGQARRAKEEFWIAVVGPLTSIAVGFGALALLLLNPSGLLELAIQGLAVANLALGVLNLIPGLPLDGGRVLKAGVWGVTKDQYRGTIVAGWGGRMTAVAVLIWPIFAAEVLGWEMTWVDSVVAVVVALFLWSGATASMASAQIRRRLPALVGRNLARRAVAVPGSMPLAEAIRTAQSAQAGAIVTLDPSGRPDGVVNESALIATPEDRRPWVPASSVARTLEPGLTMPLSIAGEELVKAISRVPAAEYVLLDESGSIYGVLATADVDAAFRAKGR